MVLNFRGIKIAIQSADLDHNRIDGTRVYILNLLKNFGGLDQSSEFLIYHKDNFNPELRPPDFLNYKIRKIPFPFSWTQLRFAAEIWKDKPDVLWMPMQTLPYLRRKKLKTAITIHDLAFKYFPENFTQKDLRRLNFFSGYAIRNSDKIIAVSESTKKDILKFYPEVKPEKIKVIYHGFDWELFSAERNFKDENRLKSRLGIKNKYILYVGAIQPRKNLVMLINAFELVKKAYPEVQLVLAGEKAWQWENTIKKAKNSLFVADIILSGKLKFDDLGHLMRGASMFVLPSLYEGFGIPVLEAMASRIPVIAANNSSLREVGGSAALYFDANNSGALAELIAKLLSNPELSGQLVKRGLEQIKKFSWEKCARETLSYLKN